MVWSLRQAARAFAAAAVLLTLVIAVSATTGASPLLEGVVVKLAFLTGLCWAAATAKRIRSISPRTA